MRASYCARATSIGSVCVAGTPVPLSSSACICGSTGISCDLLSGALERRYPGRQKTIEHLPRSLVELHVVLAVKHATAIDENAMHPERVADGARASAR